MIFTNHIQKLDEVNRELIKTFIILINPFMPHLAQELWELSNENNELSYEPWPKYDNQLTQLDTIKIAVQINGKRRSEIDISPNDSESEVINKAKNDDKVSIFIGSKDIIKAIYVHQKIVNLVIK
jgi:leucyl-tRNA synthetase